MMANADRTKSIGPGAFSWPVNARSAIASSPLTFMESGKLRKVSASESPSTAASICSVNRLIWSWPGMFKIQPTTITTIDACNTTMTGFTILAAMACTTTHRDR